MTNRGEPPDRYPGDPRGGPRRYGPTSGGDDATRRIPRSGPAGGRAWSEVGGAAWAGPESSAGRLPGPPDRPRGRTRGSIIVGRVVAGVVAALLVVVSGITWAAFGGKPHNASNAANSAGNVGVVSKTTDAHGNVVSIPVEGTNILVVGSDARTDASGNPLDPAELKAISTSLDGGGINTDTIMILHIPDGGRRATAISIPRDTWIGDDVVHADGVVGPYSDGTTGPYKANKVNSFYGSAKFYETEYLTSQGVTDKPEVERKSNEAGRTMLIKVLQQLTGIKINHYAEVNLIGFYLLSKAIGGVPVCLVNAVKDRQSGADFPAGHFEVSGSEALSFVRQRHGLPHGDLDRIRRQQAFLAGAAKKILSLGTLTNPTKLSALVDAANRSLVLDRDFNLLSFAQQMIGLTSGDINFVTMPTDGPQHGVGTDALAVDPSKVRQFFAAVAGDTTGDSSAAGSPGVTDAASVDPASVTVDVQNGTEVAGMAAAVGKRVAGAGFQRGQLADYPGTTAENQQAKTTVRYPAGAQAAAAKVLDVIGVGTATEDDAIPAGHILIVVGTDMPGPSGLRGGAAPQTAAPAASTTGTTAASTAASTTLPTDAINAAEPGCVN